MYKATLLKSILCFIRNPAFETPTLFNNSDSIMKELFKSIIRYTNLEAELDDLNRIHETIEKDVVFKGTNLWILVFAIIVASVGLNMNSTAVIIGAMLISPLMGPINGMGYAIATYDFPLFKQAVKNFSFAVMASLIASTTYFAISPVSTAHSELLARTSPTIYDVLIALFGGFAGIVAISSKQKGNVIPGVAIATALMPPLCTAGYGLATGQFNYFLGAIYLFTINTVFIGIASMIVSQVLKFPIRTILDKAQRQRVNQLISVVILITALPSIYFGYVLVQKEKFSENANAYVGAISVYENNFLLKHEINPEKRSIDLIYGGNTFSNEQKEEILSKAENFKLDKTRITIKQGISIDKIEGRGREAERLSEELIRVKAQLEMNESIVSEKMQRDQLGAQLLKELSVLYPGITGCTVTQAVWYEGSESLTTALVALQFKVSFTQSEQQQIEKWIQARTNYADIKIFWEAKS
jgi:uncharacterized hydrophobic protein (TIGR00271 family)